MLQLVEFDGLPEGVKIEIGNYIIVGTQSNTPDEEKESA